MTLFIALVGFGCDTDVSKPHKAPSTPQPLAQPSAPAAARTAEPPRHARTGLQPLDVAPIPEPQLPLDPLARAAAERNAKRHVTADEATPPPAEPLAPAPPPAPPLPPAPDQTAQLAPPVPAPVPVQVRNDSSDNTSHALARVAPEKLCVTRGTLAKTHVEVPTFRAVAPGQGGDAASLRMRVHGTSKNERALASGQHRRQVGLKLRAANGCNLVYVMWRLDPKPKLEVSVKANPGMRTSQECGANGYTKVKAARTAPLPSLVDDQEHELRAAIAGDTLTATVDGNIVWQGSLPSAASKLAGPAGVRSDNLDLDIVSFSADSRTQSVAKLDCKGGGDEESD